MAASDFVNAVINIAKARDYMLSFMRDHPSSKLGRNCRVWLGKINWLEADIVSSPAFDDQTRLALKYELNSDVFTMDAIMEKIAHLTPDQRLQIERVVELVAEGNALKIEIIETACTNTKQPL